MGVREGMKTPRDKQREEENRYDTQEPLEDRNDPSRAKEKQEGLQRSPQGRDDSRSQKSGKTFEGGVAQM